MCKGRLLISFLGLAFLIGMVASSLPFNSYAASPSNFPPISDPVDGDQLVVGDVIAVGNWTEDGRCVIGSLGVRTTAPVDGPTRWLAILSDKQQCRAVVAAKWQGLLEEGPSDVVDPLLRILSKAGLEVPEWSQTRSSGQEWSSVLHTATKTSEQHIFMYGYGGPWDQLTHKFGKLTFRYDGQVAIMDSQSGSCQGSKPFSWYEWIVDDCSLIDWNIGPGSKVWRTGRGDYHCDPTNTFPCNISNPDGYYHSLYDQEDGHANGVSHCEFWWSGDIVGGVDRYILQGCS